MALQEKYAVVIGGVNVDVAGLSGPVFRMRDSNPGSIRLSTGGVGQNIARNLVMLGIPTYMVSVIGDDSFGKIALEDCEKAGLNMEHTAVIPGRASSTYLYINDNSGDLVTAVNDMTILETLTPAMLEPKLDFLNDAACCVIDANLPKETIDWIGAHVTAPLCADTTSAAKCTKLADIIDKLTILKANDLEAAVLSGRETDDISPADTISAADYLSRPEGGAKFVFISLGERGMMYASAAGDTPQTVPVMKCRIASTNGAGDCAMAAIVRTYVMQGACMAVRDAAMASQAAASINLESAFSFAPQLNAANLELRLQAYLQTLGEAD